MSAEPDRDVPTVEGAVRVSAQATEGALQLGGAALTGIAHYAGLAADAYRGLVDPTHKPEETPERQLAREDAMFDTLYDVHKSVKAATEFKPNERVSGWSEGIGGAMSIPAQMAAWPKHGIDTYLQLKEKGASEEEMAKVLVPMVGLDYAAMVLPYGVASKWAGRAGAGVVGRVAAGAGGAAATSEALTVSGRAAENAALPDRPEFNEMRQEVAPKKEDIPGVAMQAVMAGLEGIAPHAPARPRAPRASPVDQLKQVDALLRGEKPEPAPQTLQPGINYDIPPGERGVPRLPPSTKGMEVKEGEGISVGAPHDMGVDVPESFVDEGTPPPKPPAGGITAATIRPEGIEAAPMPVDEEIKAAPAPKEEPLSVTKSDRQVELERLHGLSADENVKADLQKQIQLEQKKSEVIAKKQQQKIEDQKTADEMRRLASETDDTELAAKMREKADKIAPARPEPAQPTQIPNRERVSGEVVDQNNLPVRGPGERLLAGPKAEPAAAPAEAPPEPSPPNSPAGAAPKSDAWQPGANGGTFRVSDVGATGGVALEKRGPAGNPSTFHVGKDGNLIDADNVNFLDPKSTDKVWKPPTPEHRAAAKAILNEMGKLELEDPKRAVLKQKLKDLVTGKEPPAPPAGAAPDEDPFASKPAEPAGPMTPADHAQELRDMVKYEAGWAEKGGRLLREGGDRGTGEVTGRTQWIPASEWYGQLRSNGSRVLSHERDIHEAVEKAIAGEKLRPIEQRTVDHMMDELRNRHHQADTELAQQHGLEPMHVDDVQAMDRLRQIDPDKLEDLARIHQDDESHDAFNAAVRRELDAHATANDVVPERAEPRSGGEVEKPAVRGEPEKSAPVESGDHAVRGEQGARNAEPGERPGPGPEVQPARPKRGRKAAAEQGGPVAKSLPGGEEWPMPRDGITPEWKAEVSEKAKGMTDEAIARHVEFAQGQVDKMEGMNKKQRESRPNYERSLDGSREILRALKDEQNERRYGSATGSEVQPAGAKRADLQKAIAEDRAQAEPFSLENPTPQNLRERAQKAEDLAKGQPSLGLPEGAEAPERDVARKDSGRVNLDDAADRAWTQVRNEKTSHDAAMMEKYRHLGEEMHNTARWDKADREKSERLRAILEGRQYKGNPDEMEAAEEAAAAKVRESAFKTHVKVLGKTLDDAGLKWLRKNTDYLIDPDIRGAGQSKFNPTTGRFEVRIAPDSLSLANRDIAHIMLHESAHGIDMQGFAYSQHPDMEVRRSPNGGTFQAVGPVAKEIHSLAARDDFHEMLRYPMEENFSKSMDEDGYRGELFAQMFAAMHNPTLREVMEREAPQTTRFMADAIAHAENYGKVPPVDKGGFANHAEGIRRSFESSRSDRSVQGTKPAAIRERTARMERDTPERNIEHPSFEDDAKEAKTYRDILRKNFTSAQLKRMAGAMKEEDAKLASGVHDPMKGLDSLPKEQRDVAEFLAGKGYDPSAFTKLIGADYHPYASVDYGSRTGDGGKGIGDAVLSLISPASRGPIAEHMAGIMRANYGEMARVRELALEKMKGFAAGFDKRSNADNVEFTDRMERGQEQPTEELQQAAKALRTLLDNKRDQVRALGKGVLEKFNENYVPHMWKQDAEAAALFGRRPLEGSKAFLEKRRIPTQKDGLRWRTYDDEGNFAASHDTKAEAEAAMPEGGRIGKPLTPLTSNPVEMALLKAREMDRYIYGQRIMDEMKAQGIAALVGHGERAPEGWTPINDKIANAGAAGRYYAPDEAATLINNHLSPGLQGKGWFQAYRRIGNILNSAQLGLSAFHVGFTTLDAMNSKVALGNKQISRGIGTLNAQDVIKGLGSIATGISPHQPIANLIKGDKLLRAYLGHLDSEEMAPIVAALQDAGGRVRMDDFYRNATVNEFTQALRRGDAWGAAKSFVPHMMDLVNKPIFEHLVPRQKLGVFFDMAKDHIEAHPDEDVQTRTQNLGKLWDSVDNRMGQLVYDNLFWNRTLKDGLMATVRSVGWNVGTFRELGGGVADFSKVAKNKELTDRSAYVLALPLLAGVYGAITQYLYTGEGPRDIKDLYFPRTGKTRPDGSEDRVSLPTYMKDVYAYKTDATNFIKYGDNPTKTIGNKLHPALATMSQMLNDEDFFGGAIRSPGDPAVQQMKDYATYLENQVLPFSVRNFDQQRKMSGEEGGALEHPGSYIFSPSMIGVAPAPGYMTKSDEQLESAQVARMRQPLITKFRELIQEGQDPSDLMDRMRAAGLSKEDIHFVIRSGSGVRRGKLKSFGDAQSPD
jgi:hypothetical protein